MERERKEVRRKERGRDMGEGEILRTESGREEEERGREREADGREKERTGRGDTKIETHHIANLI